MKSYRKVPNAGAINSMNSRGEIVGTVYNKSVVWWGPGLACHRMDGGIRAAALYA